MKIATWNVAYGRGATLNNRRREQMREIDADVWVLTETHDGLSPGGAYTPIHSAQRPMSHERIVPGSRWVSIWARDRLDARRLSVTDVERTVACVISSGAGPLWIFGTVLPWYHDRDRDGFLVELGRQRQDWEHNFREVSPLGCLAGDFNVNLGGPHYYGRTDSQQAVQQALSSLDMVAVTDHAHTSPARPAFGLIDHLAVSSSISVLKNPPTVWERSNGRGELMSDHAGAAVELQVDHL